ncbi:HNH/ENDO VII family nuclease, partial [Bartonella jaculi]|uniref:HNH/ENDO VII family nuclease n=1 Tax=Bartonella jaculi TaxID=686226 RepID=UPI0031ECE67C
AAIGTSVQTALEGGSFDKNLIANLRTALSDTVGKTLAEEIGTAKAEGKIDTVTQIVAHAGLGCLKGAVASGACSAGAVGGAVGEATAMLQFKLWMQGIVKEEMGDLNGRTPTPEEQARVTARIDAEFADFRDHTIDVARAAGGVAAALAGGDVNAGADAAGNAAANNFLGSAQRAQMKKELEECSDDQCRRDVNEKWFEIDEDQDKIFSSAATAGAIVGAGKGVYEGLHGVVELGLAIVSNPLESSKTAIKGVGTAMSWTVSGHVIGDISRIGWQLWEGVKGSFAGHINDITETMDKGGEDAALSAGFDFGEMTGTTIETAAAVTTGVAGAVTGGIKLGEKAVTKFIARKDFAQFAAKKNLAELAAQGDPAKLAAKKELTKLAAKEKKNWLKEKPTKFTDSKFGQTNKVYQRNDLFDPNRISKWTENKKEVWGTNVERMEAGRAPMGFDGKPVELHHLKQTPEGPIAEISKQSHNKYSSVIHAPSKTHQSLIERKKFDKFREEYWKERAKGYREQKNSNLGGIIDMKWGIMGIDFDRWGQEHRK